MANVTSRKKCFKQISESSLRFFQRMTVRKTVEDLRKDAEDSSFKRTLGPLDLTFLGIGAIIGAGIFVLTGQAAARHAGPAIILSFVFAGIASALAGVCYAELASMIPVSGSAYTYSYATMGELIAWIIGWDLILEYIVSCAAVAVSWAGYFTDFIDQSFGLVVPDQWKTSPLSFSDIHDKFEITGGYINIVSLAVVLVVTAILAWGIRESSTVNTVIVLVKIVIVLLVIFGCAKFVNNDNYKPFIPKGETRGKYGWSGVFQGAVVVFFAYIGFDAVSTVAHECRQPQRDLPIGILSSLVICTVLYISVATVMVGVVPYRELNSDHPVSTAVGRTGQKWLTIIVDVGALCGLFSVMLVQLLGQTRIFYSMSKDGLFPAWASKVKDSTATPFISTWVSGIACGCLAAFVPLDILATLTSVGTLFAFMLVSLGVIILRYTQREAPRKFKLPGPPWGIPGLSILACGFLLSSATKQTIYRLFIWMGLGFVVYFFYGWRYSKLKNRELMKAPPDEVEIRSLQRPSMVPGTV
ncbi:hypothetical protein CBR_g36274 [Chara braunii]|uniref:Cationic amino acid transporter C-terminal domain-containing protein n=1 Tax=Chara braunii TaxID=69332 RepID=A0A388LKH8_CHABU|nr:hypothetical protein CBR_g36274 [Chara braunii]|eukprot:GBG82745.1 hypothetical protein CBR_g36274 [Chara braunii]